MIAKLSFLAGLGTGYVLGSRAGRERYEQIASTARQVWQDPRVQDKVQEASDHAQHGVKQAADKVTSAAGEAAHAAVDAAVHRASASTPSSDPDAGTRLPQESAAPNGTLS